MLSRFISYTITDLQKLNRQELQLLCKVFGVKTALKTSNLLKSLTDVAKQDGGVLQVVPFTTQEKEDTLLNIKNKEPIQISLTKFRAQSVGRIYEIKRETTGRKSKNLRSDENGIQEYFPSVTTVLDRTKTYGQRIALLRWKEAKIREMGKEGFDAMARETLRSGTNFHKVISDHLTQVSSQKDKDVQDVQAGKQLADKVENDTTLFNLVKSVSPILDRVSYVFAIESSIQHPLLRYAGTLDCILELDGNVCLVDWKTSSKHRRTISSLYDYPVQAVAYAGAANFDHQYDFQTNHVALVIAYEDGSPADLHLLSPDKCEKYWLLWLARLGAFYKDFPWETFQNCHAASLKTDSSHLTLENESPAVTNAKPQSNKTRLKLTNVLTLSKPFLKKYIGFSKK